MTAVDWDALQVGDPDPTPNDPPWCRAELREVGRNGDNHVCTRRPGHDGQHVAGDGIWAEGSLMFGASVVAIWPSDG